MNKEVIKQKTYRKEKPIMKKALETIIGKTGTSKKPIYWKKKTNPVYHRDFRSPTRH
jgi:hypothetical protein